MKGWWSSRGTAAAEWFVHIRSGRFDRKADGRWQSWLKLESHGADFEQIETAWETAGQVRHRPTIQKLLQDVDLLIQTQPARKARRSWVLKPLAAGLAATVLIVSSVGYWYWMSRVTSSNYVTAIGEQRVITLEDGSSVSLNTGTSIRAIYSRRLRKVELQAGEAVFRVAHDEGRPFQVQALAGSSTAVGTQYAVQIASAGSINVSVLEGVVAVAGNRTATDTIHLVAGQAVSYDTAGALTSIRPADLERIRAWQQQRLVFNDVTLGEAVAEFNRYLRTPVVLASTDIANRRISGVYQIGQEEAFLNALQQLYQVQVIRSAGQILLQTAR